MILSHITNLAQKALITTTALMGVENDQKDVESARIHDALFSIHEILSRLVEFLSQPFGEMSLDSLSLLLELYNSFLDSNLGMLQEGLLDEGGSPTRLFKAFLARHQQSQIKASTLRFLETIATDLMHQAEFLEISYATIEPMQHRPRQHVREVFAQRSIGRKPLQQNDEGIQNLRVRFGQLAELEGDNAQRVGMPTSVAMRGRKMSVRENVLSLRPVPINIQPSQHTQPDHVVSGSASGPSTSPTKYDSHTAAPTDTSDRATFDAVYSLQIDTEDDQWCDPIPRSCREIIAHKFPTPSPSFFDDYSTHRQRVQNSTNYRWYLNFRCLSFILQPDILLKVFLVELDVRQIRRNSPQTDHVKLSHALLYLFGDCLVLGRSPFVSELPDPRDNPDDLPLMLDFGIVGLREFPVRFDQIRRLDQEEPKLLIVESSSCQADRQIMRLVFRHICQCDKVFRIVRRFLAVDCVVSVESAETNVRRFESCREMRSSINAGSSNRGCSIKGCRYLCHLQYCDWTVDKRCRRICSHTSIGSHCYH